MRDRAPKTVRRSERWARIASRDARIAWLRSARDRILQAGNGQILRAGPEPRVPPAAPEPAAGANIRPCRSNGLAQGRRDQVNAQPGPLGDVSRPSRFRGVPSARLSRICAEKSVVANRNVDGVL